LSSDLVECLVETLNCEGICYCHWKSNYSLVQALSGETDLDLLVDRQSIAQTTTILSELGFKPATVIWGPSTPSIYHYYGYDPSIAQLVHVHLFGHVLTGESFVKSHLFPFETMLLENTYNLGQIRLASKSAELILFTLRMFIKYGSLLDLIYIFRKSEDIKAELRWLMSGSDMSEVLCLLKRYCPVIDPDLFVKCIDTLNTNSSLGDRIILAQLVRRRLSIYQKYTPWKRFLVYVQLLWGQLKHRLADNKKNKMLCAGGAVIAIVGPEATGKSTLVKESERWLGNIFTVRTVHAGKPPSTWLTAPLNMFLPFIRSGLPGLRTNRLEGHISSDAPDQSPGRKEGLTSLVYAIRSVVLAWDRRHLLVKVWRAATNGEIVICDRYPSEEVGAMDSPRLQENLTGRGLRGTLYNWLARLEGRLYKQIPPPDVVLRLNVSIETAKKRNRERVKSGKEADAYVESRHRQSRGWQRSGTKRIYDINTEQSLPETIRSVKEGIWESL